MNSRLDPHPLEEMERAWLRYWRKFIARFERDARVALSTEEGGILYITQALPLWVNEQRQYLIERYNYDPVDASRPRGNDPRITDAAKCKDFRLNTARYLTQVFALKIATLVWKTYPGAGPRPAVLAGLACEYTLPDSCGEIVRLEPEDSPFLEEVRACFTAASSAWAAVGISLDQNLRLKGLLSEDGIKPFEALLRALPAAVSGIILTRGAVEDAVTRVLGAFLLGHPPERLPNALAKNTASELAKYLGPGNETCVPEPPEVPEQDPDQAARLIEASQELDVLGGKAGLTAREAELFTRLRQDETAEKAAKAMVVTGSTARGLKKRLLKKLRSAARTA